MKWVGVIVCDKGEGGGDDINLGQIKNVSRLKEKEKEKHKTQQLPMSST